MNMDRFKFRVWWKSPYTNVSSKYLYYNPHENNYRTDIIRDADCDFAEDIIYYDLRDIILGNIDEYERPGTFTVEQCTGLKDKNGNLIYEGDIIRFCLNTRGYVLAYERAVVWDNESASFMIVSNLDQVKPRTKRQMPNIKTHNIEIIGNIHEQKDNK